jgi:hypothetical protein
MGGVIDGVRAVARRLRDPLLAVSLLTGAGYFLIARAVVNFYPFSVYPMFDETHARPSGSRIVARGADGEVGEVSGFRAWACEAPPAVAVDFATAPDFSYHGREDEAALRAITADAGAAGDPAAGPVEVLRRIWRFDAEGRAQVEDRVVGRCRAVRR